MIFIRWFLQLGLCLILLSTHVWSESVTERMGVSSQIGRFAWADLVSSDTQSSIQFYTQLLDWTVTSGDFPDYQLFMHGNKAVAGLVQLNEKKENLTEAYWVGQFQVSNVGKISQEAQAEGATLIMPPKFITGRNTQAVIADPQGAIIGLLTLIDTDSVTKPSESWRWAQLFTPDAKASADFYSRVFGFQSEVLNTEGRQILLKHKDEGRAGISILPDSLPQTARWVGFVTVADLGIALEKTKTLGGRVIYAPRKDVHNGDLAIISDPDGALLGMITEPTPSNAQEE